MKKPAKRKAKKPRRVVLDEWTRTSISRGKHPCGCTRHVVMEMLDYPKCNRIRLVAEVLE